MADREGGRAEAEVREATHFGGAGRRGVPRRGRGGIVGHARREDEEEGGGGGTLTGHLDNARPEQLHAQRHVGGDVSEGVHLQELAASRPPAIGQGLDVHKVYTVPRSQACSGCRCRVLRPALAGHSFSEIGSIHS